MARSRSPIGSSTSHSVMICSTLLGRQDHSWAGAAESWQVDLRGRIVQDVVLPGHPPEPCTQGHKPRVLRAEAQRLAVLFARVVEEMPLIAFEHGPRDLRRVARCRAPWPSRGRTGYAPRGPSPCTRSSCALQAQRRCSRISASQRRCAARPAVCASSLRGPSLTPA